MINFMINGQKVTAEKGDTILEVARREGHYIPTMCYLAKTSPQGSCRMCSIQVEGHDGFVLSCNTPPLEGISVITDSDELYKERQNIMKMYDVNHPLQCGVCDKSGECDLQNKTLEFGVSSQHFAVKDQPRKKKEWGVLSYDPHLCIMCERCAVVCNEVVGSMALYIKPGGYKSVIDNHFASCIQCGECIAVCPVGAMASADFKYTTNVWECESIPSTCAHCSSACSLNYDVKHDGVGGEGEEIYRVTNEVEIDSLCGAGRFGYDFQNVVNEKDLAGFEKAVDSLENTQTILFNSMITNEEATLLQRLKETRGLKLYNPEAKAFQKFMAAYSSVSGQSLYSADLKTIEDCDYAITLGSSVSADNPMVRFSLNIAQNRKNAYITYMHPLEDEKLRNVVSQYVKYEVGSEEGLMAMLCDLTVNEEAREKFKTFFDGIDSGYICGESSVGEEEFGLLFQKLRRKSAPVLVIGADLINHPRAENIARMVGMIDKYSPFKVLIIPPETNTLGVSLICDLDEEVTGMTLGYNVDADFKLSALGDGNLDMPALNQQEGTFVSINKKVVPLNAAIKYGGFELNDLANAVGLNETNVINYTAQLPVAKGFKPTAFDDIENYYEMFVGVRGYALENLETQAEAEIEDVDDIAEFNGAVVYRCNAPLSQFNPFTDKAHQIVGEAILLGSAQFATAARIKGGDTVKFDLDGKEVTRLFKVDNKLKGTIAFNPSFDSTQNYDSYRYKQVKMEVV